MKNVIALLIFISITGCATMPPGIVWTENRDDVSDCKALGMVANGAMNDLNIRLAMAAMLREAEKIGGTHVLNVASDDRSDHGIFGKGLMGEIRMVGTAYRCETYVSAG